MPNLLVPKKQIKNNLVFLLSMDSYITCKYDDEVKGLTSHPLNSESLCEQSFAVSPRNSNR